MPDLAAMGHLAAGDFSSWLVEVQAALHGERATDVPCGSCVACCSSSQSIHIGPEEQEALAHIPRELLFPPHASRSCAAGIR